MKRVVRFKNTRGVSQKIIEKLQSFKEDNVDYRALLEDSLKKRLNIEYALSTNSSTSAIHLSMCALNLKRGDKILCSVNGFVDIPESVRHFDAEPIFVDIDTESYNIDLNMLEDKLRKHKTKKLRAIVINHIAGLPVDMMEVNFLAKKYDVKIVEDCSDAVGAKSDGGEVASRYSHLGILNFGERYQNHFNGGALVTKFDGYASRAGLLRDHAMITHSVNAEYLYDVLNIGCNYGMSQYDSVFALDVLENVDSDNKRRMEIAEIYLKELTGLRHVRLPIRDKNHTYRYFIIEINKNRDGFARELKSRGVIVSLHYVPLHSTKYYKEKYSLKIFDFPNAMNSYQRVMSLPNHPAMSDEDIYYVCEKVKEVDSIHI